MPHRDRRTHERDEHRNYHFARDRDRPAAPREDYGQADYSADYGYDPDTRTGYRTHDDHEDRDDYGQADYREDFGYDDRSRTGYRRDDAELRRLHEGDYGYEREWGPDARRARRPERPLERHERDGRDDHGRGEPRSWMDQARDSVASMFGGHEDEDPDRRAREYRKGRVLWAVITGRMEHERGLDASDIEVIVDGAEVTLNGTVRDRHDKHLAEDIADVRGVTHVQNNLRIRRRGGWWR